MEANTQMPNQAWADKVLNQNLTNKSVKSINYTWKTDIEKIIDLGLFSEYVSANTEAKQIVIIKLAKAGFKVNVENIGCTVVKITIDNEKGTGK